MKSAKEWMNEFDAAPDRESGEEVVRAIQADALETAASECEHHVPPTVDAIAKLLADRIRELKPTEAGKGSGQ